MERLRNNLPLFIVLAGLISIIVGLSIGITSLNNDLKDKEDQLVELNDKYETMSLKYENEHIERVRLELINNDLWELYYSTVSTYDGEYEYYE